MSCETIRDRLVAGETTDRGVGEHLARCADCAAFASRLEEAARLLGRRPSIEPDPAFSARVVASLPQGPDLLGWAALRLMPVTLALALALAGWVLVATPSPSELAQPSATDDPLAWVTRYETEEG